MRLGMTRLGRMVISNQRGVDYSLGFWSLVFNERFLHAIMVVSRTICFGIETGLLLLHTMKIHKQFSAYLFIEITIVDCNIKGDVLVITKGCDLLL